jgi:exonuclease III
VTLLGSQDLDGQGHRVMTDHGTFVLFDVYVPASSRQLISYKMKFLQAFQRAMQQPEMTMKARHFGGWEITMSQAWPWTSIE